LLCLLALQALGAQRAAADLEALPFAPRHCVAYRAPARVNVDGKLDESGWAAAPWTDAFIDIEGDRGPRPRFRTRAKMLWDDEYFYVGAEMEEPDVWGTLTERDAVIFRDNDFEIFIDPDGDTHAYYEMEVNALGTPWDLLLIKPYRDGGPAIHAWDITGFKSASTCGAPSIGLAIATRAGPLRSRCRGRTIVRIRDLLAISVGRLA
jgi:hypothetical protein